MCSVEWILAFIELGFANHLQEVVKYTMPSELRLLNLIATKILARTCGILS